MRGLNNPVKQINFFLVARKNNADMVCLLETRVRPSNSAAISAISGSWKQWSYLKNSGYS